MQISEADSTVEVQETPATFTFAFNYVPNDTLADKKISELLQKWGLNFMSISSYRFNQRFEEVSAEAFLLDFFNFPEVRSTFTKVSAPAENYSQIKYKRLKMSQINMDSFDKLKESDIIGNDLIKQTYEDYFEGIAINDLLREAILKEESEHYEKFSEEERKEFLFRLFSLLVLGGQMCQWEEKLSVYLDATKFLYKSLVSARKDPATESIFIDSFVYEIHGLDKSYKKSYNPQDVLYVVVNPSVRTLYVLHNTWVKVW